VTKQKKQRRKAKLMAARAQYAAIPIRETGDGAVQVLLQTSRETRRWVIPKGWPMRKLSPADVAAREAYEEAGVEGEIDPAAPIGTYRYAKRLPAGGSVDVDVQVFLLRVERQLHSWPEKTQRAWRWCDPADAAELVEEAELAELLRRVGDLLRPPGGPEAV
jgi:8-oxo-dGTP pyrophosphatase MutT (NUDIX family)